MKKVRIVNRYRIYTQRSPNRSSRLLCSLGLLQLRYYRMKQSIKDFISTVEQSNPNEPEFIQAVTEVAETVIPFIANTNASYDRPR